MSDTGAPPPDPQSQPNPYGQPSQPNPYGQPDPYGQQLPYPPQPYGQPAGYPGPGPAHPYAHWIKRVGGYLLDSLFSAITAIPGYALLFIGIATGTKDMQTYTDVNGVSQTTGDWNGAGTPLVVIGCVLLLLPVAFFIWNSCLRQGRTGYSLGKGIVGIRLISETTGQPIGGGMAFLRYLCHIVDSIACYLGWLWPLWDRKRQTFADKILSTVVVDQPR